jgi:hypothetical protein
MGREYDVTQVDPVYFSSMRKETFKLKVEKIYKYTSQAGYSLIQKNSRRFCRKLIIRSSGKKYFSHRELQAIITPGKKYGLRDVLLNCGNYSANPKYTSCRHRWQRYLRDTENGNIVLDPVQPEFRKSTAVQQ